MLRVNPTQLKLEKRDLDWHIPRHKERQAQRAAGFQTNVSKASPGRRPNDGSVPEASATPQRAVSKFDARVDRKLHRNKQDFEIFSDDPVPRGSRAFWDKILAEAGTPTRIQTVPMARPAIIVEPSEEFAIDTQSMRASLESISVDGYNGSGETQSSPNEITAIPPSESSNFTGHREINTVRMEQTLPPSGATQPSPSKNRLSFFSFRRKARPDRDQSSSSLDVGRTDNRLSGSMAVDGPSDGTLSHYSGTPDSTSGGFGSGAHDDLYGSRSNSPTLSQAYPSRNGQGEVHNAEPLASAVPARSLLSPPRAIGHARNISGSHPRSSLYISEAAASSSPERAPTTPRDDNPGTFESQGLLSQPPRRRKMYRQRSQTYSFAQSEESSNPTVPQIDGQATMQAITTRLPSLYISEPPSSSTSSPDNPMGNSRSAAHLTGSPDVYLPSSPPEMPSSLLSPYTQNISANTQLDSSPNYLVSNNYSNLQRSLSSLASPFVPGNTYRGSSPQLPLPPPFSSTSRNVSIAEAYPPNSSTSPRTPPQQQFSPSPPPSVNRSPQRMPVYNDNIDRALQPQTPAGLPRRGVRAMATQNPFHTAPVRGAGRIRALAEWQAFATPTRIPTAGRRRNRRGSLVPLEDQENTDTIPEGERRRRREAAMAAMAAER